MSYHLSYYLTEIDGDGVGTSSVRGTSFGGKILDISMPSNVAPL